MGLEALRGNGVTTKLIYFFRDDTLISKSDPLRRVRPSRLALFVGIMLVGFAATFAITQTVAAIGFPVVIFLLVPVRMYLIPRLPFTQEELAILDGPAASSFVSLFCLRISNVVNDLFADHGLCGRRGLAVINDIINVIAHSQ
jgi:hypothetical protein